jgi:hypothetical protein
LVSVCTRSTIRRRSLISMRMNALANAIPSGVVRNGINGIGDGANLRLERPVWTLARLRKRTLVLLAKSRRPGASGLIRSGSSPSRNSVSAKAPLGHTQRLAPHSQLLADMLIDRIWDFLDHLVIVKARNAPTLNCASFFCECDWQQSKTKMEKSAMRCCIIPTAALRRTIPLLLLNVCSHIRPSPGSKHSGLR